MEQASPANGRRLGFCKPSDGQTLPTDRDSEAAPSACRMVSGGMSEVRCWFGCLVSARSSDTEWRSATHPQGTPGFSRKIWFDWLAYVPPHLSFLAR